MPRWHSGALGGGPTGAFGTCNPGCHGHGYGQAVAPGGLGGGGGGAGVCPPPTLPLLLDDFGEWVDLGGEDLGIIGWSSTAIGFGVMETGGGV